MPLIHAFGQLNPVRQAEKKMIQGNWTASRMMLKKALKKDTLNVEAELSLSRWFLNGLNPSRQVDSAYRHTLLALHNFQKSSGKQRDKLKRNQIDSSSITSLRSVIDSIAFTMAKKANTEESYAGFLANYQFAKEKPEAIELRDEVAFLNALRQNTYTSFANYLDRYPQSRRAKEAKERYEKLLFDGKTRDKKLKSYLSFVEAFPASPFRPVAERNIFELSTCSGNTADFNQFMDRYKGGYFANLARNFLFHLLRESDEKMATVLLTDSLQHVLELQQLILAPVYKNSKYGFIDTQGKEILSPRFERISEAYKCGSIREDVLLTSEGIVSRNGKVITTALQGKDIGYGFLKTGDSSCTHIIHKSGVSIVADCLEDARVLGGHFLVVKKNGLYGLYALNGRILQPARWNWIDEVEGILVFDRQGKKTLCTQTQLVQTADGNPFPENLVFDDVRALTRGQVLVSNGSLEGIVNPNLEFSVPLSRQSLVPTPFGLVRKINDRYIFPDLSPEWQNTPWESFALHGQWLVLSKGDEEELLDVHTRNVIERDPDSLWFDKTLAFARSGDSLRIHINSSHSMTVNKNSKISFIKSRDSIRYFFVEQKNKKNVFSIESGEKLFSAEYEKIESLTAGVFIVTRKNRRGLVNQSGKLLLSLEYDAIVLSGKDHLSLLKDRKFGFYDLVTGKLIKPLFERNMVSLNDEILIAFKDGHFGLIDWTSKPVTPFEFDEILPWAGDLIWVKKAFEWKLFDFRQLKNVVVRVKNFHVFKEEREERLAYVQQDNFYGVLSSEQGMIIPPSFSYITNLSSAEEPLYFTAKEVEEAGIWVVIYYDKHGKLLRKQVYEDEEYARIVCREE